MSIVGVMLPIVEKKSQPLDLPGHFVIEPKHEADANAG